MEREERKISSVAGRRWKGPHGLVVILAHDLSVKLRASSLPERGSCNGDKNFSTMVSTNRFGA